MSATTSVLQLTWEQVMGVTGWILGAIGVTVSVYYGKKSLRLERERITLNWEDIQIAADDLTAKIKSSQFLPTVIFTFGSRSAYFAHLLSQGLPGRPPVIVGITLFREEQVHEPMQSMLTFIETSRWQVGLPTRLLGELSNKILLVDDWVLSGDSMQKIREQLESGGLSASNIKSATVVATEVAVHNKKGPDFYWKLTASTNFFFPWGRAT